MLCPDNSTYARFSSLLCGGAAEVGGRICENFLACLKDQIMTGNMIGSGFPLLRSVGPALVGHLPKTGKRDDGFICSSVY